ncbi:MAG: ABC transporter permease [Candidatus Thiodiazotropha sp. (ex. Lucinisca nassula)]|nr:ABC transporter permease [Candidatus Thiodiazotropha sp. (ex. Lucinisca nassula)]MBW9275454.1 ABC transporter permease [Candidatus Thiodiazotropha sp. (ex. Lucinisca nassula)]PUB86409.1 MAG: ABC transporter permease [gamma proteobacterium symbiont of Ctena orbiculata]PUB91190.1 MAG: ABC transporter permease [gamma proteobacterium symbiont of Ctena orbiculata]
MRDLRWIVLYLLTVVGVTLIHQPLYLLIGLVVVILFSGSLRWRLLRKALLSVLLFNTAVSLGYLVIALLRDEFRIEYLILINARVLLLVMLGFWLSARINFANALRFSPTLTFLTTLAAGQIRLMSRIINDYRAAFESRCLKRPNWRERSRLAVVQTEAIVEQSHHAATEISQAMRSRGVFND